MAKDDKALALFLLLNVPGIGPARLRVILERAGELRLPLEEVSIHPEMLRPVLSDEQITELRGNVPKCLRDWQKLCDLGVAVISIFDKQYPQSLSSLLGKQSPPLLFFKGNADLFHKSSLGFCGSRKASEKGLSVARDCARIVSEDDVNVVSGYAAGVDMATHCASLEAGGTTVVILAEGMLHFRIKREIKELWDWERVLVVSQYSPGLPWSVHNAMARNDTICALCKAMVLIEARDKGGSMEAGRTCLRLKIPLFAPVYEGMPEFAQGNRILLNEGAKSLYKNKATNLPNLHTLLGALREQAPQTQMRWETPTTAAR
jgi:DNA processing protein